VSFIDVTIAPVREIVIVISDLYLASAEADGLLGVDANSSVRDALPGFEHAARFGRKERIEGGWRSWLARWLGRDDLASLAPAAVAAAEVFPTSSTVWIATPVHLIASLTRLHLDRHGILRLSGEDLASFATDFARTFDEPEFKIKSIDSGEFIIQSLATLDVATIEPARAAAGDLEMSLPKGRDAAVLRRLGAELEMWLHSHPINEARVRRGELPVSTLWIWGGGAAIGDSYRTAPQGPAASAPHRLSDVAFGSDPYLTGLWRLHGGECHPLPERLPDLSTHPHAHRAALVMEISPLLHANPHWTVFEALAGLDHRFISPALAELRRGAVASVVLVANDMQLRIQRSDRLKFWRRRQSGVEGLR